MGRRSEHSPQELRELILAATRQVIVEAGFQRLSAREIARAIGYAPGTLYNMFRNLDEILMRVETRVLGELDDAVEQAMLGKHGIEAVRRFASAYVEFAYGNRRLWELIQEHHPADRTSGPDWYLDRLYASLPRLEQVLSGMSSNGDADDVQRTARLVWSAVHGVLTVATTAKFGPLPLATTISMAETLAAQIATSRISSHDELRREDPADRRNRHAS